MRTLSKLIELKTEYKKLQAECYKLKTKAAREKRWDAMRKIKVEFSMAMDDLDFSNVDFKALNVMAIVGGPYCTIDAENFEVMEHFGNAFGVSFNIKGNPSRYAGIVYLLDDKCGIDNLEILNKKAA